jgi:hypothetical protein
MNPVDTLGLIILFYVIGGVVCFLLIAWAVKIGVLAALRQHDREQVNGRPGYAAKSDRPVNRPGSETIE